jgi:hypothetical protein
METLAKSSNTPVGPLLGTHLFVLQFAGAGLCGWIAGRQWPQLFAAKVSVDAEEGPTPLVADDALHGELPSMSRALRLIGIGALLWASPVVLFAVLFGRFNSMRTYDTGPVHLVCRDGPH